MDYGQQQANSQWPTTAQFYESRHIEIMQRICVLEQQVANQAKMMRDHFSSVYHASQPLNETALKSQAAQQQATEHLYAPLRSDTKPLLEMAAFVRKIADYGLYPFGVNQRWIEIVTEAREILKRST